MPIVRVVLLGGFLGAGKTTTILRLARFWTAAGLRVGVVTNDQAADLIDTETFRSAGVDVSEVPGGCFCCRFDDLVSRVDDLIARAAPSIIIGEPVGSCTDIVATVIKPLQQQYPDRFAVAPYGVLVDPLRARRVLGGTEPVGLSERVTYIYRLQQQESDFAIISKCDLLTAADRAPVVDLVRQQLPGREVLLVSARTGEGIQALAARVQHLDALGEALDDIDYERYAEGEAELGWLNSRTQLAAAHPLALDAAGVSLARDVQSALTSRRIEVAHGKIRLTGSDESVLISMVSDAPIEPPAASARDLPRELTINLRAQGAPSEIERLVRETVEKWTARHGLEVEGGRGLCFSPPRPVPTHRIARNETRDGRTRGTVA